MMSLSCAVCATWQDSKVQDINCDGTKCGYCVQLQDALWTGDGSKKNLNTRFSHSNNWDFLLQLIWRYICYRVRQDQNAFTYANDLQVSSMHVLLIISELIDLWFVESKSTASHLLYLYFGKV